MFQVSIYDRSVRAREQSSASKKPLGHGSDTFFGTNAKKPSGSGTDPFFANLRNNASAKQSGYDLAEQNRFKTLSQLQRRSPSGSNTDPAANATASTKRTTQSAPTVQRRSVATDPAYQAYMRMISQQTQQLDDDASLYEARVRRGLSGQLEDFDRNASYVSKGIRDRYQARGIGGSGLENRDVSRSDGNLASQRGSITSSAEDAIRQRYEEVLRRQADMRMRAAEQALTSQGKVSVI